ncbi:cytochrome c oxidase subunit II [Oscillatoria sp. CS-180]|uniref:cytochrome c oxidase subunit II n=1 Tax=Oscillatoria sp. CS-180 TaxID=3021720 RepID=UPI00232B21FB|nr:cytochrome c oxidase subunit II [Oscillatoria sp. CS-180]MDB9527510.1 cytochrome c oxidase subunit II [Oscillatoria sp. CS-180]
MTRRTILILTGLAIADFFLSLWIGQQAYNWMPPQASAESMLVDNLFSFMTTIGSFIFFGVTGTLVYSILFQRAAKYDSSDGPPIEGNVKLEVVWTAIPVLLVIWIGTFSYQTYDRMAILGPMEHMAMGMPSATAAPLDAPDEPASPIKVYARQWAWEFHYPDQNVSSTELHLPVNERARLLLSSEDVLHGFFVPAFRVKQDVVPGREIDFEFTPIREGRYRLRDSEYSGTYFAANQTNVVVESAADYQHWLAEAADTPLAPAQNVAYEEFNRANENAIDLGWETVKPAPAPVVNYASSEEDTHE